MKLSYVITVDVNLGLSDGSSLVQNAALFALGQYSEYLQVIYFVLELTFLQFNYLHQQHHSKTTLCYRQEAIADLFTCAVHLQIQRVLLIEGL